MKSYLGLVFILVIFGVSCKEEEPETDRETLIKGTVANGNSKEPIKGAKILVWEYRRTDDLYKSQRYRYKAVDSAFTDEKGDYSIRFKPSKSAVSYKPEYHFANKYYYNSSTEELTTGTSNTRDLLVYETKVLKARIIYSENPYPPLTIRTWSRPDNLPKIYDSWELSHLKLYAIKGDTTVLLKVIPQTDNNIAIGFFNGNKSYFKFESLSLTFSSDTLTKVFNIQPKDLIK